MWLGEDNAERPRLDSQYDVVFDDWGVTCQTAHARVMDGGMGLEIHF